MVTDGMPADVQHTKPCSDCPWRRDSIAGWLGSEQTAEDWVQTAHGETSIECHVHHTQQCAGSAIYRANVAKSPRYKEILALPKDTKRVFATPMEFLEHHQAGEQKQKRRA